MGQPSDIVVPEGRDAVLIDMFLVHLVAMLVSQFGMFKSLPGLLLPGLVVLFLMGFRGATMRVGRTIVQIGSSLMVLVMRSVFITSRHLKAPYLPRLGMSVLGKLISLIRVLQRSLRMIFCSCEISFFVMFGGGTMFPCREFV